MWLGFVFDEHYYYFSFSFVSKSVTDYLETLLKEVLNYRKENNVNRNDLFQHITKSKLLGLYKLRYNFNLSKK